MGEVSEGGTVEVPGVGAGAGPDVELAHARLRDASCIIVGQPLLDQKSAEDCLVREIRSLTVANQSSKVCAFVIASEESKGNWSQRGFPKGVFARVYRVDPDEPRWGADGVIGDLLGWVITHQLKLAQPVDPKVGFVEESPEQAEDLDSLLSSPVCVGGLGSPEVQHALRVAAGFAGIPYLSIDRDGSNLFVETPPEATLSAVLEAYRLSFGPLEGEPREALTRIRELGGWSLLRCVEGHIRPSYLLDALTFNQDNDIFARPDYHSMCADLLDRRGCHSEAATLRRLIKFWRSQNIWSANLVPEMVLHDAAHSQSVDRIIASLCEPLLNAEPTENRPIDEADLVILACAAWLHDWGCNASASIGGRLLTDPRDVRALHGYLSQIRLKWDVDKHKLNDPALGFGRKITDQVGLISAHHVGHSSCGSSAVAARNKKRLRQPGVAVEYPKTDTAVDPLPGGKGGVAKLVVQSFDNDLKFSLSGLPTQRDLDHAHRRLALLRIADAIDAGWHRIPNYETQTSDRVDIAKSKFTQYGDLVGVLTKVLKKKDPGFGWNRYLDDRRKVHSAKTDPLSMVVYEFAETIRADKANFSVLPVWARDKAATTKAFTVIPPKGGGKAFRIAKKEYFKIVRDAVDYADHLLGQAAYFREQRPIRAVIPVLQWIEGTGLNLTIHALAGVPGSKSDEDQAKDTLRLLYFREFGQRVDRQGKSEQKDQDKNPIAEYFAALGITVQSQTRQKELEVVIHPSSEPPQPGRHFPRSAAIKPLASIPNGWGDWDCMVRGKAVEFRGEPPHGGLDHIACCIDKTILVTASVGGGITFGGGGDPVPIRNWTATDCEVLALSEDKKALLVRAKVSGELGLYELDWDDNQSEFRNPEHLNSGHVDEIVRALYVPYKGEETLFAVLREGGIQPLDSRQGKQKRQHEQVTGIDTGTIGGIDVVRQGGAIWIAYIRERTVYLQKSDEQGGFSDKQPVNPKTGQDPYRPVGVWFAAVPDDALPLLVIEERNDEVGDGRLRCRWMSYRPPMGHRGSRMK